MRYNKFVIIKFLYLIILCIDTYISQHMLIRLEFDLK